MRRSKGKRIITIPWENVRQWVVVHFSDNPARGSRYGVYGRGTKPIIWHERPDDRLASGGGRAAFAQRAEELHAMIAAKTGLPLLELPYIPRKRRWWSRLLLDE